MALSETGEYVGSTVSETGARRFGSLLEHGAKVFGVDAGVVNAVQPTDFVVVTDGATVLIPRRTETVREPQPVSDAVATQLFRGPTVYVQGATDRQDVSDAAFLQHLMREIRATDHVQFAEQVAIQLLTRDLRITDNLTLADSIILALFDADSSGGIEAILAGIRTFTCTPGYDIQREAITKTAVADFDQPGLFSATNGAARPSYRFVVNISALTRIQVQSLQAFHFFHQGGKAFYIDGFTAWSSVTTLNLVGEGNGTKKDFFLPNRNIDPNSITVAVFDGATHSITTAYSLNAGPGIVSFNTAPSSGHDIEAAHGHKYKVVFEPDGIKIDEFAQGVFRAQLKLRELAV